MVIFPGSKINIGLNIIGKRSDSYHNLQSIFYPLNLSDILEIIPSKTFSLEITGIPIPGEINNNLIVKAYELIEARYQINPVKIHLHKVVPMGAGLGGGSADGAATLLLLNQIFSLTIPTEKLIYYAEELGSDCAFFIRNKTAYIEGKGEIVNPHPLNLNGFHIQLINPGIHISTKDAFAGIKPIDQTIILSTLTVESIKSWKENVKNDFERTIFPLHATIRKIKDALYENGAIYASMTGTGSSVFGIFKEEPTNPFPEYFEWHTLID